MKLRESSEMYLETILKLEGDKGVVRSVDIANELKYTKPSVNRAMGILKEKGYITKEPYGSVMLTETGKQKAQKIHNAHHIITDFLVAVLKVDKKLAEIDACKIEHIISEKTLVAMKEYLKNNQK